MVDFSRRSRVFTKKLQLNEGEMITERCFQNLTAES